MGKLVSFPINDNVYNLIADYLRNRSHCMKVNVITSASLLIKFSTTDNTTDHSSLFGPIDESCITQDSIIEPLDYIFNASDLGVSIVGKSCI